MPRIINQERSSQLLKKPRCFVRKVTIINMSHNIKVGIKLKPSIDEEKEEGSPKLWSVDGNSIVSSDPETITRGKTEFKFDYVFDTDATTYNVFNSIVKPIVNATIDGINGTVFCYGQCRSGKTYTMIGNKVEPGIIPMCIKYIFNTISNTIGREFLLRVSYLEISNETVNDLLNVTGSDVKLHKDANENTMVNCKEEISNTSDNMLLILKKGNRNTRTRQNDRNDCNSSHKIFRITIESREVVDNSRNVVQISQLNLVDLAGFERAHEIDVSQEQQVDASLLAFESIIVQLNASQDVQEDISFPQSKLTEILQSSINGNSLTAIIFTVIPTSSKETHFTLSFACQANTLKTKPRRIEITSDASLLVRYSNQITKLQIELQSIRNGKPSAELENVKSKLQEKYQNRCLLEDRITLLKNQIISGTNANRSEPFKCKSRRRKSLCNNGTFKSQLPVFRIKSGLPTIKEMSPEKPFKKDNKQLVDVSNQTFQTAFTDFEVDLIECELSSETKENVDSIEEEDIDVIDCFPIEESKDNSGRLTPDKQDSCVQTVLRYPESPSTPKKVLRKYISDLTKDLIELREFTTLEKQIMREEIYSKMEDVKEQVLEQLAREENEVYLHSSNVITELDEEEVEIKELDEIKNDIRDFKSDMKKLEETIVLLTNENVDMSTKLNIEKEHSNEVKLNYQKIIDNLHTRISQIMEEKTNLESNLTMLNEQLQSLRLETLNDYNDEQLLAKYESKIDSLKSENIKLSIIVAEKNKELEEIKESKSLLYDHECIYKDKIAVLTQSNTSLMCDNNELSNDLMDRIQENEMLQEECNILKNKVSLANQVNSNENDMEHLQSENNFLRAEVMELKMKVTMLSEENVKISNNLFEAMEDLDNSRCEKQTNTSIHPSSIFDNPNKANQSTEKVPSEESREVLLEKVEMLQDKVDQLTCLNKKLSDLKLTSCSQCAYLRNLSDSRRALKIETKILNRKLEDLQKKFDQKCIDTEVLKLKANQDLNLSFSDSSLNVSLADGLNVSFIEEKVQHLNNELQTLKDDNDKLSVLYQEKCDELEKLHDGVGDSKNVDSKSKKNIVKHETRIQKIQTSIDQVRDDIDKLKTNSVNFASMLNKFRTEKASLLEEINTLRSINEELQQKVSDTEISAVTATEKAHILETELLSMSKEIEQYSEKEKEIKNEKLKLEVELENKDTTIKRLHKNIDDLNECISSLKNEVDSMMSQKNETIEMKHKDELELLQKKYQNLEVERKQCAETEKRAILWAKELEKDVEKLQTDLGKQESLYKEVQEKVSQLESLLKESESEKETLKQNLQSLEVQLADSKDNLAIKYKAEYKSLEEKFKQYTKESEIKSQKINETLNKYVYENDNLKQELAKLQTIELKFQEMKENNQYTFVDEKTLSDGNKKLHDELNTVRESMIKELKSFKQKLNSVDLLNKTANEIFIMFLQTLMAKEEEVIKTMRDLFEQDKQKLEDEKKQSADAQKRVTLWAKELERETEKLQIDLTKRETTHTLQQNRIYELEHLLKENNLEKETLKQKMEILKTDLNNLQNDFDRQCKLDCRREEAIVTAQKKEKEIQEEYRKRETEFLNKVNSQKETYDKRIGDLMYTIESYKTKNQELKSNIEGLEANEKQLKNIIEANALEMKMNNQTINKLNNEVEQLVEAHKNVNCEVQQKTSKIEEISALLKKECNVASEYKAKLDIISPDFEILKEQVKERKACIERYKEQIEVIKMEKDKQIETIKDKLNSEEIKNIGLNKQLHELNNKNIALMEEIDTLEKKITNLQSVNSKLEKKIRNSTSKIKAEAEMEDLKDLNRRLQNNLEGASNRITELQESKNKILKELVSLKGEYEMLSQENAEIKATFSSYKSKQESSSFSLDDSKYDAIMQEKNTTALELEDKKLLLNQKDKEIKECSKLVQELTVQNRDLNELLKNHATIISEREKEISRMKDKLYLHRIENKLIQELEEKLQNLREENKKLQENLESFKSRPQIDLRQMEDMKLHNEKTLNSLRKEISELQEKLNEYENKLELKSNNNGSRSASPAFEVSRRRYSRNKIFNEKRLLEDQTDEININESDMTCQILRKQIQELELQIVAKNGQIETLEIQIQSENFPYHQKCKELEEVLLSYRNKNVELSSEVSKLERALNDVNAWECDTCRKWRINRRDQSCQTLPDKPARLLTVVHNGMTDDYTKIMKLEKEKTYMKDLCRQRNRRIKELEDALKELSQGKPNDLYTCSTVFNKRFDTENNTKQSVKIIVPTKLELRKPVNYRRNLWNNY
ncbi:uncharacterized protein LOC144476829 [Augochlora pura]